MPPTFLLYGATGYTGSLTARMAVQRGLKPILAGRDPAKVKALADELGLAWRAFPLEDGAALNLALREVPVVLHCAGPYSRTYKPMVDACLRTGTHYLDITGELMEHEALAGRDAEAQAAGVMLLPSVGFDVVPSDCLAAHLKRRLPSATQPDPGVSVLRRRVARDDDQHAGRSRSARDGAASGRTGAGARGVENPHDRLRPGAGVLHHPALG